MTKIAIQSVRRQGSWHHATERAVNAFLSEFVEKHPFYIEIKSVQIEETDGNFRETLVKVVVTYNELMPKGNHR